MYFHLFICLLSILLISRTTTATEDIKFTQDLAPPNIISRLEWKAEPPNPSAVLPASEVIISHTASKMCYNHSECTSLVQKTQTIHIEYNGWDDIAYNFLVGGDGFIYEGRGWDNQKGHKFNQNQNTVDIAFIGTFNEMKPNDAQISAAKNLIESGILDGKISGNYKLFGQRQRMKIDSPGDALYNIIKTWDHWTSDCSTGLQSEISQNEIKMCSELMKCLMSLLVAANCSGSHNETVDPAPTSLEIVSRQEWIAQPPRAPPKPLQVIPASHVIISHTATAPCLTKTECTLLVRTTQTFHIESRGWDDIAYNFLVGGDGYVYEGRGWDVEGAHTFNYNTFSIGISFIGTFMDVGPTEAQLHAAKKLMEFGAATGKIAKDYILLGHRQCIKTESPGEILYNIIKSWEHWSSKS